MLNELWAKKADVSEEENEPNEECQSESEKQEGCDGQEGRSKSSNQETGKTKSKTPQGRRGKKKCPLDGCSAEVVHLPRHMREKHGWGKEQSRTVGTRYGMRKGYTHKEKRTEKVKYADYHRHIFCPIAGCRSVVKRLPPHLKQHHGLSKDSEEFRKALSQAFLAATDDSGKRTPVPPSHRRSSKRTQHVSSDEGSEESEDLTYVPNYDELHYESDDSFHTGDESDDAEGSDGRAAEKCDGKDREDYNDHHHDDDEDDADADDDDDDDNYDYDDDVERNAGDGEERDSSEETEGDEGHFSAQTTQILNSFKGWLESSDGGLKNSKAAKQHATQIKTIVRVIDKEQKLDSLFKKKLVRDVFLKRYTTEKNYLPGTIKCYLMSLRHFYKFVLAEEVPLNCDRQEVPNLSDAGARWSASYRKASNKRKWEKMEEDLPDLLTPEMIQSFDKSLPARDAVSLLGQLSGAHSLQVTQSNFVLVRDFLITQITIANANRSGVLSNMTFGQFQQARMSQDHYVITVTDHKTASTHGPAKVVLNPTLFRWLKIYVGEVRSQVKGKHDVINAPVFVTWYGEQMSSGQMTKAIQSIWNKAGLGSKISSILLRKSAVSRTYQERKEMAGNLADLMGHSVATAAKYYRLIEKEKTAVQGAKELSSIMRPEREGHSKEVQDEPQPSTSVAEKASRVAWTSKQLLLLRSVFRNEIAKKSVTLDEIRQEVRGDPELQSMDIRRVYDRVRAEWRFPSSTPGASSDPVPGCSALEPPSTQETLNQRVDRLYSEGSSITSGVISPTVSAQSSKGLFCTEDKDILARLCRGMISAGPIIQKRIKQNLESEPEGKQLLEKFEMDQLLNRIKYERRLHRKTSSIRP